MKIINFELWKQIRVLIIKNNQDNVDYNVSIDIKDTLFFHVENRVWNPVRNQIWSGVVFQIRNQLQNDIQKN